MSGSQQLFNKYINDQCSPEEVEALMMYFHTDQQELLSRLVLQELEQQDVNSNGKDHETLLNNVYKHIQAKIHQDVKVARPLWYRIAAAAAILITFSIGGYFILHNSKNYQLTQNNFTDIAPGGNNAILTLGNGQKVDLSNAKNGIINQQAGIKITKNANGKLTYEADKTSSSALSFNSVETPNGGQYQIRLPDGTKVWINAASKLSYPERFVGKERLVELSGEAYFEVVHNDKMPFKVKTFDQTIEDIGTHFNINAYNDEKALTTTLLEGSIKVSTGTNSQILKPGQQSQILYKSENHVIQVLNDANTEEAVAWKNGYFRFTNEKIEPVMRKLARWYNINVSFEGQMSDEGYYGKISRFKNISQVLKMLEKTKAVHFKVEGRRVTVIQ